MYIVAIAWLYVTLMMAVTEKNLVAGVMTFTCYGVLPLALVLWLAGGPRRRAQKRPETTHEHVLPAAPDADGESRSVPHDDVQHPDGADAKRDQ